jgi:release factor glutamine methyltransferase
MHPIYTYIKQVLHPYYQETEAGALAKWILTEVFHFSTFDLYAGKDMNFSENDRDRLEDILNRLRDYEPLQYVLVKAEFGGLSFEVTPDVLIPRPETLELVEWITADCQGTEGVRILDIGTGSGCIPVTLYKRLEAYRPQVASWDISEKALEVAGRNAVANGAVVTFCCQDVLSESLPETEVDVLVSNPPYIAEKEKASMERNVLDWEPGLALFVPDDDPLLFYRRIAEAGLRILSPKGRLYYEINRAYGKETVELLERLGYTEVELRKDLSGNDRMVKAVRP